MAKVVLPDTDVLVDFFRGHNKAVEFVRANSNRLVLSPVVIAELYAGVKNDSEEVALDQFVSLFPLVPVSAEIAKEGGLFKQRYGRSHGTGIADAILAATAVVEDLDLATLNVRHYPMFKGLKAPYRK